MEDLNTLEGRRSVVLLAAGVLDHYIAGDLDEAALYAEQLGQGQLIAGLCELGQLLVATILAGHREMCRKPDCPVGPADVIDAARKVTLGIRAPR
jgi:hypothetical protein